ncbi:MAG TPA: hypothetical protein VGW38_09535 [Chloroflexota bacterium]|nr:hypothetical protein [Chloroflexota bacterium]
MSYSERLGTANWVAAALVGVPAVLELALILHHPVPARTLGSATAADPFGGIAAVIDANRVFHAVLIILMLGQLTGLLLLARKLGLHRPLVVGGAVFCVVATVLLLLATSYDGFVTFELISRCRASADGCGRDTRAALDMILTSVQAFTKLGLVAQSFGFAAFAFALFRSAANLRVAGAIGLLCALAPLGLIMSGSYIGAALIMQIRVPHALLALGAAFLLGFGGIDRVFLDDACTTTRGC